MTKSELIQQLQKIKGNPDVLVKPYSGGDTLTISEVDGKAYCEKALSGQIVTSSRKVSGADMDPCIVLWTNIMKGANLP